MHGSLEKKGCDLKKVMGVKESNPEHGSWLAFSKWYFQVPQIYQRGTQATFRHKECKAGVMAHAQNPTTQKVEATRSMQVQTQQIKNQCQDWESLRERHH